MPGAPLVAITLGDPCGIGPEIVAKAFSRVAGRGIDARLLVIGSLPLVAKAARGIPALSVRGIASPEEASAAPGDIAVFDPEGSEVPPALPGHPAGADGVAAFGYLRAATTLALSGGIDAIVTAPVNKKAISDAGIPFQGHTEYLAGAAGVGAFAMMLVSDALRVVPVTRHIGLARVATVLTTAAILATLRVVDEGLRNLFGMPHPRIAVTALNPHGGEGGLFGGEEGTVIAPAVEAARAEGVDASGPYPADTVIVSARRGNFDVVVTMYHDQAMIPVKLLSFGGGVNVTLGLPFVRTSVDHGTAYDIAGRGIADPGSLVAAIELAVAMAAARGRG